MSEVKQIPWDTTAFKYQAQGYSVIPLAPREKGPRLPNWSTYCDQFMSPDNVRSFFDKNHNIGCCMGKASRTMAIDVDTEDEDLIIKVRKILPVSPVEKKGAKGFTAFYFWEGQSSQSFKNGINGIDILASGRQTVLPPSIHPKGMEYVWLTERTLLDVKPEALPRITESQILQLKALFQKKVLVSKVDLTPRKSLQAAKEQEVMEALEYINPDESYELWVEIGMAIQSEFEDSGFQIFNTWSSKGPKYEGMAKCYKKYCSFSGEGVTIGTLFHYAISNGYEQKSVWGDLPEDVFDPKEQREAWDILQTFVNGGAEEKKEIQDNILLSPPGLLGQIYEWMSKCTPFIQPMYVVPAAISVAALVYAHKFKTDTGARSNVYSIAVGPSGSGKTVVANLVTKFLSAMPPHYIKMLMGEPKSDAGLVDALLGCGGKGLLTIDEIGHFLCLIRSNGSNPYTIAIGAEFTKFFSRANGIYISSAYSSNSKKPSIAIPDPCLIIYGQSVKDKLFKELKEDDFIDGFFNRWLIFESETKLPVQNTDYTPVDQNHPSAIVDFINRADKKILEAQMSTNAAAMTSSGLAILKVDKTQGAAKMLAEFAARVNSQRESEPGLIDYPLSRAIEHCEKLSLIACEWTDDLRPAITEKSVTWAVAAVEHNLRQIRSKLELLTSSDYEALTRKVLDIIPVGAQMSRKTFADYTKFLPPKQRDEILKDLIVRKILVFVEEGKNRYLTRLK